ncbi:4942_t:CDS:2 [Ambispora gerdemannii]|uniref:4942_t:CDS:1 n=1 Tax=Ambispora gerdemannii TaxID=144530 RepID=A0A9N9BB57_9GLOM|nr:4942_t:CDS:2 [Ambispora gerdemannii]
MKLHTLDEESFQLLLCLFSATTQISENNAIHASLLGFCYYHGIGIRFDRNHARKYYKIAGDLNDGFALAQLGDLSLSVEYYKKAVATGHPQGVFRFAYGYGYYQRKRENTLIFRTLAEKDYLPAIYSYVKALYSGKYCNRDLHEALRYAVKFHRVSGIEGEGYDFTFIFS